MRDTAWAVRGLLRGALVGCCSNMSPGPKSGAAEESALLCLAFFCFVWLSLVLFSLLSLLHPHAHAAFTFHPLAALEQRVLVPQVFASVCLINHDLTRWIAAHGVHG